MPPTDPQILWQPNSGPQTDFLRARADEVCYGGAAGGGKSAALFACPLRWVSNPRYRGLYLRREAKYLGEAIDKTRALYTRLGARLVTSPRIMWTFPSGATLWMNHCEHESDVANYDSFEFSEVLWDELTHFTEKQYLGVNARLRGTDAGLPYWSRAGTNPGGVGHEWVFKRWGAWLNPQHPRPAAPGVVRWYRGDEETGANDADGVSRTFIPARLADNPHIDPTYRAKLLQLDPVRRAQLDAGDWLVKPAAGVYFHPAWWVYLDAAPHPSAARARCRSWDFGASPDGDWTVGVRLGHYPDEPRPWVVEDVVRLRGNPGEVRAMVKATAERDGTGVRITVPQDPGQAGKDQAEQYVVALSGYDIRTRRPDAKKVLRASPASAQAAARQCALVRGLWNDPFVQCLAGFPDATHDDDVDAFSDAFNELAGVGGFADGDLRFLGDLLGVFRTGGAAPATPARPSPVALPRNPFRPRL